MKTAPIYRLSERVSERHSCPQGSVDPTLRIEAQNPFPTLVLLFL